MNDSTPMGASPAIPTMYAGIQFRSRLEATWAAMFDNLGIRWEYEPVDLDGYIPDFVIAGQSKPDGYSELDAAHRKAWSQLRDMDAHEAINDEHGPCEQCDAWDVQVSIIQDAQANLPHYHGHVFVEVKPAFTVQDFKAHTKKVKEAVGRENILFLGATPIMKTPGLEMYFTSGRLVSRSCEHRRCGWGDGQVQFWHCDCTRGLVSPWESQTDIVTFGGEHQTWCDGFTRYTEQEIASKWAQAKNTTQWNAPKARR